MLAAVAVGSSEELVFTGNPTVRVDADDQGTKRIELSESGGQKFACRVVKNGRRYYWASRGNRELIRSKSGDFTYFTSPEGSGYIKVFSGRREGGPDLAFDYLEHVSSEFKTITYWGKQTGNLR